MLKVSLVWPGPKRRAVIADNPKVASGLDHVT